MMTNEAQTDLWVYDLLKDADIKLDAQGSKIVEIKEALKTASKNGSGNVGFPEYVGVVKDFLIVVEDKSDLSNHIKLDSEGRLSTEPKDTKNYAVNGAVYYAKHLFNNTSYKKVIAFGISGNEKKHKISPYYIDETEYPKELPEVESFVSFSEHNIDEYYTREILGEETDKEKETAEILKDAAILHEDLRNYGNLKDIDKPLIVSGILLALKEMEHKNFDIDDLTGDSIVTDGTKVYDAIRASLTRSNVAPEVKKDKILNEFLLIKDTRILNEKNDRLGMTPLKHFAIFLNDKIYKNIRYTRSSEDYLGRFYGEFMAYSGGDGQSLGIVLTPKHITDLFCDLVGLNENDVVLDPCCGTAGFLIAAMHNMLEKTKDPNKIKNIKQRQLHGYELQSYMFTIATTNMILRGDGKSNLINDNFLRVKPSNVQLKQATVGMMNPPYSQGSKKNPDLYEIAFTEHMLDSLVSGARAVVIVPQSSMTGKTKEEKAIKENILKKHTLEGVINLNKDTFYGVGTTPCIAIFTAWEPHPKDKECKFVDFKEDGFKVAPHIGLIETEQAKDKKQHLLDVWFGEIEAENKFCVKTAVEAGDEWLHSFYYFNDEIPTDADFEKTVGDYMSFEFSMIMQGRGYLFNREVDLEYVEVPKLSEKEWGSFKVEDLFRVRGSKTTKLKDLKGGDNIKLYPYVTTKATNNGIDGFYKNTTEKGNVITFDSATIGYVAYQLNDFSASDHVEILEPISFELNQYRAQFIIEAINKSAQGKFDYGFKLSQSRMKKQSIVLPVDSEGKPDYDFMEQYIKNLMYIKYREYLDFKK